MPACGRAGAASTSAHVSGASAPVAWARSPTTVSEPLSERRVAIFSCIGVRSWTSSTTMWPNVRISSASSTLPPPCRAAGPRTSRASSSRATSAGVQRTSSTRRRARAGGGRRSRRRSSSRAAGQAQQRRRAEQVVQQLGRREHRPHPLQRGPDLGHLAQRLAHGRRSDTGSPRHVDAIAAYTSPSTNRRPPLWRR